MSSPARQVIARSNGDLTIEDVVNLCSTFWQSASKRVRIFISVFAALFLFLIFYPSSAPPIPRPEIPAIHIDYGGPKPNPFNATKVALLIENRANPILAPLVLHFISVVPPDWRFRFMGSVESIRAINVSTAIRDQVQAGKLDLTYIPSNMSTSSQEDISKFMTNLWLYETLLAPAEHLLVYQTDSILCANSKQNLNDFLEYDWVGAPWDEGDRFGGNGGLSLRRVSSIIDVLKSQTRTPNSEPEDVWLNYRLGHRPGAKLANGTLSLTFSGEQIHGMTEHVDTNDLLAPGSWIKGIDDYRDGFYEPMGFHTGWSGNTLHGPIWGTNEKRNHIWAYCPEVKMTLAMDAAKYVPGSCNNAWKRDEFDDNDKGNSVHDEEELKELVFQNLRPW